MLVSENVNKTLNAKRNIIWGITSQLVSLGMPFILRTVIIYTLGTEYLGLNSLFTSIIQVLNLSELGFASAIVYNLYKPVAEQNKEEICAILNYYKRVYKIIGLVILGAGLLATPFIPFLINGTAPDGINIYVLFLMYLVNTVISYLLFAYEECMLIAHQRNDLSSKRHIAIKFTLYIIQIIVLLAIRNYYVYLIALPATTILNNLIIHFTVRKYFPDYIAKGEIRSKIKSDIKTQVSGLMIIKIGAITRNSFDSIIASSFLGLTLVGVYGNYYYIMSSVQAVMLILLSSIQAGVGNNIVTKGPESNYLDYRGFSFIYAWISGFAMVCMVVIYRPFIRIWVGEECLLPFTMSLLMGIYFYLLTMGDVANVYIDTTGMWWKYKYKSLVEAFSNLILNIALVRVFGIHGIVLATIVTRLLFGIIWGNGILFKNYFGLSKLKQFYIDYAIYFSIAVLGIIAIYALNNILAADSDHMSILLILECLIIPNALYLLCYLKTNRYKYMMSIVYRLVNRKRGKLR